MSESAYVKIFKCREDKQAEREKGEGTNATGKSDIIIQPDQQISVIIFEPKNGELRHETD